MGAPLYNPAPPNGKRPVSSQPSNRSSDVPPPSSTSCDAATKTARLVENFKQRAAEWAAADSAYSCGQYHEPRLVTGPAVEGGTEAAVARWRRATDSDHGQANSARH